MGEEGESEHHMVNRNGGLGTFAAERGFAIATP